MSTRRAGDGQGRRRNEVRAPEIAVRSALGAMWGEASAGLGQCVRLPPRYTCKQVADAVYRNMEAPHTPYSYLTFKAAELPPDALPPAFLIRADAERIVFVSDLASDILTR